MNMRWIWEKSQQKSIITTNYKITFLFLYKSIYPIISINNPDYKYKFLSY